MNKNVLIGLGILAVAGIGYYMWNKKSETKSGACGCSAADGDSEAQGGGNTQTNCVTTCESTPSNPNQSPTVYQGACTPNQANQPYAGFRTITRCGGAVRAVKNTYNTVHRY